VGLAKPGRKVDIGVKDTLISPTLADAGIDKNLAKRSRKPYKTLHCGLHRPGCRRSEQKAKLPNVSI